MATEASGQSAPLSVEDRGDETILKLSGRLDDAAVARCWSKAMDAAQAGQGDLRVDSGKVDFCFNVYGPNPGEGRLDYVFLEMEVDVGVFRGMFSEDIGPVVDQAVAQGLRVKLQPQGVTGL
ncbi:MAG: hypothetical protein ACKO39_08725, partial [Chthoniobacterales bacterium]